MRACVRAWCVRMTVGAQLGGLAALGSFSLFPPCFGKACLCFPAFPSVGRGPFFHVHFRLPPYFHFSLVRTPACECS